MKNLITKEGLAELRRELEHLKTVVRDEIATEIEKAREQGDLSENAAYKAAMDKKELNEMRISQLENEITNAEVVEGTNGKNKIGIGSKAKLLNETLNKEFTFEVVGQNEADPGSGKISIQSPLGVAMTGKKKEEKFSFTTPNGEHIYKVLEII